MWRIKSFGTFDLDDANYYSYLREGDNPNILPTVTDSIIKRGSATSVISGFVREMDTLKVWVSVIGTASVSTLIQNLIGALDNRTTTLKSLVIEHDVTAAEWYVMAKPSNIVRTKGGTIFQVVFTIPDRVWRKAATPTAWAISSSPATQAITNVGNQKTHPVFTFKPTTSKGNGFFYRSWVPIYNPSTTLAFKDWGLDLSDGGVDSRPWVADAANKCQVNNVGGITAVQTTIPYDAVTGAIPSVGMGYCGTEQIAWTGKTGTTSGNLTGCTRGIGGTTAATHADNDEIKISYMMANGNDLRLYMDGLAQSFWVRSPNAAATKLWCVYNGAPGIALTISAQIAVTGAIATIDFASTMANVKGLKALPDSGMLLIGTEAFTYRGRDQVKRQVLVDARAAKDTSMALHAVGATAYWIEHECWLYSGNPSMTAIENDDTKKPIIDLDASNNNTRVYTSFWDATGLRANSFRPLVIGSTNRDERASRFYTGDHTDETADPATEMGMRIMSVYKSSKWQYENGHVAWSLYDPAGISEVTEWIYEKYRLGVYWPATAALQKSKDGISWISMVNVATPASSASWGSPVTAGPYTPGTGYYHLRVDLAGTINGGSSGGAGYEADLEVNSLTYVTVNHPVVAIYARGSSSYELDCRLTNTTNGQYFNIRRTMKLNEELEIDCALKTVTNIVDGQRYRSALLVPDSQIDWMSLEAGANTLQYEENGAAGVTLIVEHDDMLAV